MKDTVFLLVKATIRDTHQNVHEAITELQQSATCMISNTKKVKVLKTRFMDYKLKSK